MLPIFLAPDDARASTFDLTLLNQFIAWIRSTHLPPTTREDAVKIVESLRWVKVNQAGIKQFIDHKADYLAALPERDRANGVVRDHQGTSIHFNSYVGEMAGDRAVHDLLTLVTSFERAFNDWHEANPLALTVFVAKCNYDKELGCLEARVADPMAFAAQIHSSAGIIPLADLVQICQILYCLSLPDDTYNFMMADHFFSPYYTKSVLNITGEVVALSQENVFEAMITLMSYTRPSPEELLRMKGRYHEERAQVEAEIFSQLTEGSLVFFGRDGMIRYYFAAKQSAEQLAFWLRRCERLQPYSIDRCRVRELDSAGAGAPQYRVCLMHTQYEVITGKPPISMEYAESEGELTPVAKVAEQQRLLRVINLRDTKEWMAYLKATPTPIIDELLIPNVCLLTRKLDSATFTAVIAKASAAAINNLVLGPKADGDNDLCAVLLHQPQAFGLCLDKLTPEALDHLRRRVGSDGYCFYHTVAVIAENSSFQSLVAKMPNELLEAVALMRTGNGHSFFDIALMRHDDEGCLPLINRLPKALIEHLLALHDEDDNRSLHHLSKGIKKRYRTFEALADKVAPEVFHAALMVRNRWGETPLHRLFAYAPALTLLLARVPTELLSTGIVCPDTDGNTPMHAACTFDNAAIPELIAKMPTEVLNRVLMIPNRKKATPFLAAVCALKEEQIQLLIDTLSAAVVDSAVANNGVLFASATVQHRRVAQALVNRATPETLNRLLLRSTPEMNILYAFIRFLDPESITLLAAKIGREAMNKALIIKDMYGYTPMHWLAIKQNTVALDAVVRKASVEAVQQVLLIQDEHGCTPLHYFALHQDEAAITLILGSISIEMFKRSLAIKDGKGLTPIHHAARQQTPRAFQVWLAAVPAATVNALCLQQDRWGYTLFHYLALHQDTASFLLLLSRVSVEQSNKALLIEIPFGQSLVHLVQQRLEPLALQQLVSRASVEVVNQVLLYRNTDGHSGLHAVAQQRDSEFFAGVVGKASREAIKASLLIHADPNATLAWLSVQFKKSITPKAIEPWILLLSKLANSTMMWRAEETIDKLSLFLDRFKTADELIRNTAQMMRTSPLFSPSAGAGGAVVERPFIDIEFISLTRDWMGYPGDAHFFERVRRGGLASWDDWHQLKEFSQAHPLDVRLSALVQVMARYHCLNPAIAKEVIYDIHSELASGNLLVKVFSGWQPKAWPEFLKQLKEPWVRASLRRPLTLFDPLETHKYDHAEGVIKPYTGKAIGPKIQHATHAKKTSMTLLSPELCTPLFQSHHIDTELVGIAFRADPDLSKESRYKANAAKPRALLFTDQGTYNRDWRGSESEVTFYAAKVKNYTDFGTFKEDIKNNKKHTNEVLAEPSKHSLLGVVIGRDTLKARRMARQYQQDIKRELGLELPIIFYDAHKKIFIEDLELYEAVRNKENLLAERARLLTQTITPSWQVFAFLSGEGVYEGRTYAGTVLRRLQSIDRELAVLNRMLSPPEPALSPIGSPKFV